MGSSDGAADAALFGLIARLADNKYFLGRRYAEWCSGAPTLESGVAAAAMAQDELGHARAIYPLLRDLATTGTQPSEIDPDTRTRFVNVATLDDTFGGWPDFVAANFLLDTAFSIVFEAARGSSCEPLAARSRKVLQEEHVHALHGEAWVRRLARALPAVREALEFALLGIWDEALCWFGPPDADDSLARAGVLDASPDTLRGRFLAVVGPTIETSGVRLPVGRSSDDWELTRPLPWSAWDANTYRLTAGTPTGARPASPTAGPRSDA